jgi:plasmid stability protein
LTGNAINASIHAMKDASVRGIPDEVYRELRIAAAEQEKSMNALIVEILEQFVAKRKPKPKK